MKKRRLYFIFYLLLVITTFVEADQIKIKTVVKNEEKEMVRYKTVTKADKTQTQTQNLLNSLKTSGTGKNNGNKIPLSPVAQVVVPKPSQQSPPPKSAPLNPIFLKAPRIWLKHKKNPKEIGEIDYRMSNQGNDLLGFQRLKAIGKNQLKITLRPAIDGFLLDEFISKNNLQIKKEDLKYDALCTVYLNRKDQHTVPFKMDGDYYGRVLNPYINSILVTNKNDKIEVSIELFNKNNKDSYIIWSERDLDK